MLVTMGLTGTTDTHTNSFLYSNCHTTRYLGRLLSGDSILRDNSKLRVSIINYVCYCTAIEGYILESENTERKVFKLTETTKESRLI